MQCGVKVDFFGPGRTAMPLLKYSGQSRAYPPPPIARQESASVTIARTAGSLFSECLCINNHKIKHFFKRFTGTFGTNENRPPI